MSKITAIAEFAIVAGEVVDTVSDFFSETVSSEFFKMLNDFAFLNAKFLGINEKGKFFDGTEVILRGVLNLTSVFLWGILLFFCFKSIFSYFLSKKVDIPWKIFVRGVVFWILANASTFICFSGIFFAENLTEYIREYVGKKVVTFEIIEENIVDIEPSDDEEVDVFDFNKLLSVFVYFSSFALSISLGIRYLIIKALIILSPIFFCFGIIKSTEKIFFLWGKMFLGLVFLQFIYAVILGIVSNINFGATLYFNVLICAMEILFCKGIFSFLKLSLN